MQCTTRHTLCAGTVCRRVLQHRSVVKLIVLHRVIGEQAPAHMQGGLGGRIGQLWVDHWGRRSCFCGAHLQNRQSTDVEIITKVMSE